jgi:general secretion pathway protein B
VSYILDALRKSDQLRRRGAAPMLLLGQPAAAAPKRPAPLAYGLLALVLLGTGMAIGWLHPWQRQPVTPAPLASTAKPPEISQGQAPAVRLAPAPKPELQAQNSTPVTPVVSAPTSAQLAAPAATPVPSHATAADKSERQSNGRQSAPPKAAAGVSTQAAAPLRQPAPGSNSSAAAAAPVASVITMAELPVAIQQELPPMSVSVHAYSGKPAERLVDINGHLLHEGEDAAPGLRLEQITPEGMILSYKGYTFRRGVR